MEIPEFKNTHCAIDFVNQYFGDRVAFKALATKRRETVKKAEAGLKVWKDTGKKPEKLNHLIVSSASYREAIEMMTTQSQWKKIWVPLLNRKRSE